MKSKQFQQSKNDFIWKMNISIAKRKRNYDVFNWTDVGKKNIPI
jgi:hypothetical protein